MPSTDSKREKAREVVDILEEISVLLVGQRLAIPRYSANCASKNTQLDRTQLSLCVSLVENGVNPEALAVRQRGTVPEHVLTMDQNAIKELRRETQDLQPEPAMSE
jgi:mitotic-spindle organizing protein 1